ncbi:Kinesin light chain [Diplonema papillatum]|nr:Kinesin light chain [Diplonema papillatum]
MTPSRTETALYESAMSSYEKGRYKEAEEKLDAVFSRCGDDAELMASVLLGLGTCKQMTREHDEALRLLDACVRALEAAREEGAHEAQQCMVSPLVNIGLIHFKKGEHDRALAKFKRAQSIVESSYCTDRMARADVYHNIGVVYDSQGDLTKALKYYVKSLQTRERFEASREQQLLAALTKENIAMIWRDQDNHREAVKMMQAVLPVRRKLNGDRAPEYANALFNTGLLHFDLGHCHKAMAHFEQCYTVRLRALGPDHPQTQLCQKYLDTLHDRNDPLDAASPERIAHDAQLRQPRSRSMTPPSRRAMGSDSYAART